MSARRSPSRTSGPRGPLLAALVCLAAPAACERPAGDGSTSASAAAGPTAEGPTAASLTAAHPTPEARVGAPGGLAAAPPATPPDAQGAPPWPGRGRPPAEDMDSAGAQAARERAAALAGAALESREARDWQEALRALELAGGEAGVLGIRRIAEAIPEAEAEAAVRLSRIASRDAGPALLALLDAHGDRGALCAAAARALGRGRLRAHIPRLVALTRPGLEDDVRLAALAALGELADPDALPALGEALGDASSRVRRQSLRSLRPYRTPAARALLEAFLARRGEEESSLEVELARTALAEMRGEPRGPLR